MKIKKILQIFIIVELLTCFIGMEDILPQNVLDLKYYDYSINLPWYEDFGYSFFGLSSSPYLKNLFLENNFGKNKYWPYSPFYPNSYSYPYFLSSQSPKINEKTMPYWLMNYYSPIGFLISKNEYQYGKNLPPVFLIYEDESQYKENLPRTGSIEGIILDDLTYEPLENVSITIKDIGFQASTDNQGRFIIHDILEGWHEIIIDTDGYISESRSISIIPDDIIDMTLYLVPTLYLVTVFFDEDFQMVLSALDYAPVVSIDAPPSIDELLFITNPSEGPSVLSFACQCSQCDFYECAPLSCEAMDSISTLDTKAKIINARNLNKNNYPDPFNDNRGLFNDINIIYNNYNLTTIQKLDTNIFSKVHPSNPYYWPNSKFDYVETRQQEKYTTSYTGPSILQTEMIVHKDFQLEGSRSIEGRTYFLQKLKVEKWVTLSTSGNVKIFTTQLELEEGSRLMGGTPENPKPGSLIIVAEYWPGFSYDKNIHGVRLGPGAQIYGRIFAPNMEVHMSRNKSHGLENETKIYGSILTKQLILNVDPAYQTNIGYIRIIGTISRP
ncbi:MAG: carboxypeptidase-like regulatory domain-containing protein [bacterium]